MEQDRVRSRLRRLSDSSRRRPDSSGGDLDGNLGSDDFCSDDEADYQDHLQSSSNCNNFLESDEDAEAFSSSSKDVEGRGLSSGSAGARKRSRNIRDYEVESTMVAAGDGPQQPPPGRTRAARAAPQENDGSRMVQAWSEVLPLDGSWMSSDMDLSGQVDDDEFCELDAAAWLVPLASPPKRAGSLYSPSEFLKERLQEGVGSSPSTYSYGLNEDMHRLQLEGGVEGRHRADGGASSTGGDSIRLEEAASNRAPVAALRRSDTAPPSLLAGRPGSVTGTRIDSPSMGPESPTAGMNNPAGGSAMSSRRSFGRSATSGALPLDVGLDGTTTGDHDREGEDGERDWKGELRVRFKRAVSSMSLTGSGGEAPGEPGGDLLEGADWSAVGSNKQGSGDDYSDEDIPFSRKSDGSQFGKGISSSSTGARRGGRCCDSCLRRLGLRSADSGDASVSTARRRSSLSSMGSSYSLGSRASRMDPADLAGLAQNASGMARGLAWIGASDREGSPEWFEKMRGYSWERAEVAKATSSTRAQQQKQVAQKGRSFDFLIGKQKTAMRSQFLVVIFSLTVCVGFFATCMILLFDVVEHKIADLWSKYFAKWLKALIFGDDELKTEDGDKADDYLGKKLVFCAQMIIGCALSTAVCNYFVRTSIPECSGAGTDAARISMAIASPIQLRIAFARIFLSGIYIGMGNPLGMEAPILHICAVCASASLGLFMQYFGHFMRWEDLATWVLVGITSGLAAAFEAPLAGITYAVEEVMMMRKIGLSVCLIGIGASVSTYLTVEAKSRFLNDWLHVHNSHSYLVEMTETEDPNYLRMWGHAILISLLAVFFAELWAVNLLAMRRFLRLQTRLSKWNAALATGATCGVLGSIAYLTLDEPSVWGPGRKMFTQLLVIPSKAEYDQGARKNERMPTDWNFKALNDVHYVEFKEYIAYFFLKLAAIIMAAASGSPGGIFYPALLLGGCLGGSVMCLLQWLDAPENAENHRICIYCGMCGLFVAMFRVPLTGILVTFELTGLGKRGMYDASLYPIILTSLITYVCADHVCEHELQERIEKMDGLDIPRLFEHGLSGLVNEKIREVELKLAKELKDKEMLRQKQLAEARAKPAELRDPDGNTSQRSGTARRFSPVPSANVSMSDLSVVPPPISNTPSELHITHLAEQQADSSAAPPPAIEASISEILGEEENMERGMLPEVIQRIFARFSVWRDVYKTQGEFLRRKPSKDDLTQASQGPASGVALEGAGGSSGGATNVSAQPGHLGGESGGQLSPPSPGPRSAGTSSSTGMRNPQLSTTAAGRIGTSPMGSPRVTPNQSPGNSTAFGKKSCQSLMSLPSRPSGASVLSDRARQAGDPTSSGRLPAASLQREVTDEAGSVLNFRGGRGAQGGSSPPSGGPLSTLHGVSDTSVDRAAGGSVTPPTSSADRQELARKQALEKEKMRRREVLKSFTPAQRILLRSSVRARTMEKVEAGKRFQRLSEAGNVKAVHQAILSGSPLDLVWIRNNLNTSLPSLFIQHGMPNAVLMLVKYATWDTVIKIENGDGLNPLEECLRLSPVDANEFFLQLAEFPEFDKSFLLRKAKDTGDTLLHTALIYQNMVAVDELLVRLRVCGLMKAFFAEKNNKGETCIEIAQNISEYNRTDVLNKIVKKVAQRHRRAERHKMIIAVNEFTNKIASLRKGMGDTKGGTTDGTLADEAGNLNGARGAWARLRNANLGPSDSRDTRNLAAPTGPVDIVTSDESRSNGESAADESDSGGLFTASSPKKPAAVDHHFTPGGTSSGNLLGVPKAQKHSGRS
ncbi:unnamed protein product [Amoebophrya sp. A25]|nr:unnamed protein product [Amoebophrya sp. A25]|eukprot:GSA25T00024401001.1